MHDCQCDELDARDSFAVQHVQLMRPTTRPPPPQFTAGFVGPIPGMEGVVRVRTGEAILNPRAIQQLTATPTSTAEWLELIVGELDRNRLRTARERLKIYGRRS